MEYLVMECHTSYAVVLDRGGRFKKVANMGYQVGQEVDSVVEFREPKSMDLRRWTPALTAAACLCIVFTGVWQMLLLTMGTVLIRINPQVRLNVNRMERVISAEAVNADGAKILFDYSCFGKTVEQVTEELSDRAAAMGYLTDGGEVHLTVDSQNAAWKTQTEQRLETVIVHDAQNIVVIIEHDDDKDHHEDDDDIDDLDDDDDDDEIDDVEDEDCGTEPEDHDDDEDEEHHGEHHGGRDDEEADDDDDDDD